MKKTVAILFVAIFLVGCSTAKTLTGFAKYNKNMAENDVSFIAHYKKIRFEIEDKALFAKESYDADSFDIVYLCERYYRNEELMLMSYYKLIDSYPKCYEGNKKGDDTLTVKVFIDGGFWHQQETTTSFIEPSGEEHEKRFMGKIATSIERAPLIGSQIISLLALDSYRKNKDNPDWQDRLKEYCNNKSNKKANICG